MTVYEYDSYKQCVNAWVQEQPNKGYGIYSRIAAYLGTNSVIMSQVFKGDRDLNLEQAAKLAQFMGLGSNETDYFLLLVQIARSGTHDLTTILKRQAEECRLRGQAIKNRIKHEQLTDEDKAVFYSSWYFIATWLAAPIAEFSSVSALSKHFNIPEEVLADVLRFLLDKGLLIKKSKGFDFGTNVVHVPHDSPFVVKHHMNWRMKSMQSMDRRNEENLHYTAPLSLSADLAKKIREEIVQFIQKQTKKVADSPSEKLVCLNIDWFQC
ncbi:MAG: TIGR02147 family protein [Bacteriovoracia bacterium]